MLIIRFLKRYQRSIHKISLFVIVFVWLLFAFGIQLPQEWAILVTVSVLVYILNDVSDNIYQLSRPIKFYKTQFDMYSDLEAYIDRNEVKSAILIQYSGQMVKHLTRKLLKKGAQVSLYIKSPETAPSELQNARIDDTIKQIWGELGDLSNDCSLTIWQYKVPGSLKGVLINDDLLAIGWYTYEHVIVPDESYPKDKTEVSGHDVPGILLYKESPEFMIINEMFLHQVGNYQEYNQNREPLWQHKWKQKREK